jgi:hypothetical protein
MADRQRKADLVVLAEAVHGLEQIVRHANTGQRVAAFIVRACDENKRARIERARM